MRIIDLSHPLRPGLRTYPGLPAPGLSDHLSFEQSREHYEAGTEFLISRVTLVTSTGTYIDAPLHRYPGAADVSRLEPERCAMLPAVVVDLRGRDEIGAEEVPEDIAGCAVLFHTGWDRHWEDPAYGPGAHPHLVESAARVLVERDAFLAGIDSVNIDGTSTRARPVHSMLLAAGIPIVENLTNLGALPPRGMRFTALPPAFEGAPSFPVRAFATGS